MKWIKKINADNQMSDINKKNENKIAGNQMDDIITMK
jgi:hypothetical protein